MRKKVLKDRHMPDCWGARAPLANSFPNASTEHCVHTHKERSQRRNKRACHEINGRVYLQKSSRWRSGFSKDRSKQTRTLWAAGGSEHLRTQKETRGSHTQLTAVPVNPNFHCKLRRGTGQVVSSSQIAERRLSALSSSKHHSGRRKLSRCSQCKCQSFNKARQFGRLHQLSVAVYDTDHGNMGSEDPVVSSEELIHSSHLRGWGHCSVQSRYGSCRGSKSGSQHPLLGASQQPVIPAPGNDLVLFASHQGHLYSCIYTPTPN